jgi:hypothetical protein
MKWANERILCPKLKLGNIIRATNGCRYLVCAKTSSVADIFLVVLGSNASGMWYDIPLQQWSVFNDHVGDLQISHVWENFEDYIKDYKNG